MTAGNARSVAAVRQRENTNAARRRLTGGIASGQITLDDLFGLVRDGNWAATGLRVAHVLAALIGRHDPNRVQRLLDEIAAWEDTTLSQLSAGQRIRLVRIAARYGR